MYATKYAAYETKVKSDSLEKSNNNNNNIENKINNNGNSDIWQQD